MFFCPTPHAKPAGQGTALAAAALDGSVHHFPDFPEFVFDFLLRAERFFVLHCQLCNGPAVLVAQGHQLLGGTEIVGEQGGNLLLIAEVFFRQHETAADGKIAALKQAFVTGKRFAGHAIGMLGQKLFFVEQQVAHTLEVNGA